MMVFFNALKIRFTAYESDFKNQTRLDLKRKKMIEELARMNE